MIIYVTVLFICMQGSGCSFAMEDRPIYESKAKCEASLAQLIAEVGAVPSAAVKGACIPLDISNV